MNFVFDIDGTITQDPKRFTELMRSLKSQGHGVYILTGGPIAEDAVITRTKQLDDLNIPREVYNKVIPVQGSGSHRDFEIEKGCFCKENNIDFVIDNEDIYLNEIKKQSPKTICLRIL